MQTFFSRLTVIIEATNYKLVVTRCKHKKMLSSYSSIFSDVMYKCTINDHKLTFNSVVRVVSHNSLNVTYYRVFSCISQLFSV